MTTSAKPTSAPPILPDPAESQQHKHQEVPNALDTEPSMTDRYTNAEWAAQISDVQRKVLGSLGKNGTNGAQKGVLKVPAVGSPEFAQTIDHTLLKLDATASQIDALCGEARTEGFKSVCVRLSFVPRCTANLKGSPVVVACVIGFHEGNYDTYSKLQEAKAAVDAGASELDIVLNHTILTSASPQSPPPGSPPAATSVTSNHKPHPSDTPTTEDITASNTAKNRRPSSATSTPPTMGPYSVPTSTGTAYSHSRNGSRSSSPSQPTPNYAAIYTELASLRSLCPSPITLKLILETSQLSPSQILAAATLAAAANFDFIKTSTGFNGRGATLADVELMTRAADYLSTQQPSGGGSPVRTRVMKVKASGGIRSLEDARRMLEAGAKRLGTSSGLWIMQEARRVLKEEKSLSPTSNGPPRPAVTRLYTDNSIDEY